MKRCACVPQPAQGLQHPAISRWALHVLTTCLEEDLPKNGRMQVRTRDVQAIITNNSRPRSSFTSVIARDNSHHSASSRMHRCEHGCCILWPKRPHASSLEPTLDCAALGEILLHCSRPPNRPKSGLYPSPLACVSQMRNRTLSSDACRESPLQVLSRHQQDPHVVLWFCPTLLGVVFFWKLSSLCPPLQQFHSLSMCTPPIGTRAVPSTP